MKYESLGYPCRNFCFFEIDRIPCDPLDGREKIALSTCVHGGTARIIILDPEKDTGECYDVPQAGEMAAWGLLYLPDYGKLLAGTCARGGYLCSLDLATRKWDPSVNIPGETYFWNLTRGGDGLVYGTSYPGCIMFRYDPATGILDSAGRVGDDPENLYTRPAMTLPNGNVIIGCGCHTYHMYCYDVKDHTFTPFGQDGELAVEIDQGLIVSAVQYGDIIRFYDAETLLQVDGDVSRSAPSLEGARDPRVIAKIRERIEPHRSADTASPVICAPSPTARSLASPVRNISSSVTAKSSFAASRWRLRRRESSSLPPTKTTSSGSPPALDRP